MTEIAAVVVLAGVSAPSDAAVAVEDNMKADDDREAETDMATSEADEVLIDVVSSAQKKTRDAISGLRSRNARRTPCLIPRTKKPRFEWAAQVPRKTEVRRVQRSYCKRSPGASII
mmetsp:Transcript_12062/g.27021  ORF Transcript_12062/g.27021 Transcript_12062/m.27021 type:complete len:116 (-) Transcript_12062:391-738(-)